MDAKIAANMLHDSGFSDSEIGELVGVTREYINKVRSGKKTASMNLEEKLQGLLSQGEDTVHSEPLEISPRPIKKPVQVSSELEEDTEGTGGWNVGDIITVGFLGLFAVAGILGAFLKGIRK